MAELPPRTRELIHETKIEGLSTREAADRHRMTESAVKVAIHRGLKALGGKYGGASADED
jgi:RNA polymerase sigma-70 factor (ECF subfamily)